MRLARTLTFYASLVRHAHLADVVVIAGYGFGDAHVNAVLRSRMTSGKDRPLVMILDLWQLLDGHPLPVNLRATERWHFEMSRALGAQGAFEHPRRSDRLDQNLFEVDENYNLAIWYRGFTEAADHIHEIIKWLDD